MKYKTINKYKPYEISEKGAVRNSRSLKVLSKSIGNLAIHAESLIVEVCKALQSGMRNIDVMRKYNVSKDVVKDLKAGNTWKHITKDYTFPTRKGLLSEDTVRWVCDKIVTGFSNTEILKLSSNENLKLFHIKNIRYKTSYLYISKDYF